MTTTPVYPLANDETYWERDTDPVECGFAAVDLSIRKRLGWFGDTCAGDRTIPLSGLVATEALLNGKTVDWYVKNPDIHVGQSEEPEVFIVRGVTYVADGHHRIAAAIARGDTDIEATVFLPTRDACNWPIDHPNALR